MQYERQTHPHAQAPARKGRRRRVLVGTLAAAGIGVVGIFAAPVSSTDASAGQGVVRTDQGLLRGVTHSGYTTFQGIPYAAPPVGKLRWAPPHAAAAWHGVRDATRAGSSCPQMAGFDATTPSTNEDCLYLNVTTPRHRPGQRLPVLVFLHGGGFYGGAGNQYGGERLATRGNVVVVTVNYRLGALGYLANAALDREQPHSLSGNYGLEDQQAALRWIQHNASTFGGDGHNVTLSGESAGAISTCAQLVSPSATGLFQRAIIESGMCPLTTSWSYPTEQLGQRRSTAEREDAQMTAHLGCTDPSRVMACLRGKPVKALLGVSQQFGPVIGGGVVPVAPATALARGTFHHVPVIEGTNRDEQRLQLVGFDQLAGHRMTESEYRGQLVGYFGETDAAKVMARYPVRDYGSREVAFAAIFTDHTWVCSKLATDRSLSRHVPTYVYEFADRNAPWLSTEPVPPFRAGAFHSSELQYLYNTDELQRPLNAAQQGLSDAMIGYWTRFARTGNPNGAGATPWLPYVAGHYVQSLAPQVVAPVNLAQEHDCGFWRSLDR